MKNTPTPRIGLLLCDDVDEAAQAQHGTYTEMFTRGLRGVDANFELIPIRCYQGELPDSPDRFDAFIISGARCAVYESPEWIARLRDFVRECYAYRKKTVGICFGHQLIAYALGGETRKADAGWGMGIHRVRIIEPQPWMADSLGDENDCAAKSGNQNHDQSNRNKNNPARAYNLAVNHQDQVIALPPGFRAIAENDFCPVSMMTDGDDERDGVMLGIQGHPEFNKAFGEYRLASRKDQLTPERYRQSLASLAQMEADSVRVFRWIARFIRGGG